MSVTNDIYVKKKNQKIQVCADFSTGFNDCLKDHTYSLSLPEDIFSKVNCGWVFSKMDLPEVYLQLKVDEECSTL